MSRSEGILSKLQNFLPFAALCKMYYSMVHSHLLYGIVIRGNTFEKTDYSSK